MLMGDVVFIHDTVHNVDDVGGAVSWHGRLTFPVCLGFSLIVMRGVTGVRKRARMQAKVLARAMLGIVTACICYQSRLVAT